jgi:hypothetical protein
VLLEAEAREYMKYVSFPWPPLETAPSIFNASFFVKNNFWEEI